MSGGVWAKKLPPKTHNWFIVDSFCLSGLDRLVWGKCFTYQMWARYIKNNHPLSDSSLVEAAMLNHALSYDTTLRHIDLHGKMNDKGVYHHYLTGKNTSTIHCYHVRKKGEARYDHKFKTGWF